MVVAVILKGWPRLSETFIAQELVGLERLGLDMHLFCLRHPTDTAVHPVNAALQAPVAYLPEYLRQEPRRVLAAWWRARRLPGYRTALRAWWRDYQRDRTINRVRRLGQAFVLATEMPAGIDRLYAHFLHTPASVTRYAAMMRRLPYSVSAHAKDIWTTPAWEKAGKLADAAWTVTCTQAGYDHLRPLTPASRLHLVRHGLDRRRFPAQVKRPGPGGRPFELLAVARAVPKKGLDVLLRALARLPEDLDWRLSHIGGGEGRPALQALADELGLAPRIAWRGAQAQDNVLAAYRAADIVVLPSRVADDGDRDGLPNVLMEALSQSCAVVTTPVGGIPELITDGRDGLLVRPDDPETLARAIARLMRDPALRQELGAAGALKVQTTFAFETGLFQLAGLFGLAVHGAADSDAA
ncbi:glycosyltransferase family 4 protein [Marinivivus vitaminiproducens]|uniref:glycosyltransferase family 4 protein n=1 Tax=Marinivivus vitaminiproducens TaxID=3035935 RepID=UPI002798DA77|nr:glycosyltransferase family 4 protein [Geminicoccaceae bacterium SCSIO 64248]